MTTHIRIPDISPVSQAVADGSRKVFDFPFPIFQDSDLEVRVDGEPATGGVVSGAGSSSGGAVRLAVAPAAGSRVTLRRRQTYARVGDFADERAPTPHELNDAVDQTVAALQELAEETSRSLKRPLSADLSQPVDLTLPAPEAGRLLGWNGAANALVNITQVGTSDVLLKSQNLADLPDTAQARLNLGLAPVAASGDYADLTGAPVLGSAASLDADTDPTLAADSDARVASQKAVKAYIATQTAGASPTLHHQVFTSSGTFTVPANATAGTVFKFTVVGGGGGGYQGYTGGGGGGTAVYYTSGLTNGQTCAVTVGSGGGNGTPGTAGGVSSVVIGASTVTGNGGLAGTSSAGIATPGGSASGGTLNIAGSASASGYGNGSYYSGGSSHMGFGATNNSYATGYGGGGSWNGGSYGNGTAGIVIVEWIA
ncbi:phage tail fiber protein [Magnetospirillum sp. SS-4]|uniref:phage tail fiber domain-containing protein n=1 Tax=Magnetospirillum sp. SS-4 TaxID=2681465 RepID=UPI00137C494F|nr:phage tail fiber protein [Magnetospirillum sp. SS-4]CAA7612768.1 conserved hypothetical protein [Magnetospirillum sp. SS-4]